MRRLKTVFLLLFLLVGFLGCTKSVDVVKAPDMDVEVMTDEAMQLCDENGDGFIEKSELKNSPSIKFAKTDLDTDKDGKISRDELHARFSLYVEMSTGLTQASIYVRKNSRQGGGLVGATVKLVPEPFMEKYIEGAEGKVIDPENGATNMSVGGFPGVRVGFYKIEITSDDVKIPAKFNTETIYGVEIPPVTSEAAEMVFVVKGR